MTGPEVTAAVERGVKAFMWADETGTAGETVTGILSAALDTHDGCHEAVVPDWADGEEMPCAAPVVGYRMDEEAPYPVCGEHMRAPMVPLRAALIGEGS